MPEPVVIVGGGLLLLALLGGKKKNGGGPLKPLIDPDDPNKTDPIPGGSKSGWLPKGGGYGKQIPDGMTSNDLWVSDDCQAFVMGQNWLPTVGALSPYQWMAQEENLLKWNVINQTMLAEIGDGSDPIHTMPNAIVLDFAGQVGARVPGAYVSKSLPSSWGDYNSYAEVGIYPSDLPMSVRFAIQALADSSPSAAACAETLPGAGGANAAQWQASFRAWRKEYPALDFLLSFITSASVADIQSAIDEYEGGIEF